MKMEYLLILEAVSLIYLTSTKTSAAALPCRPGTSFNLTITVDDYMRLYIDGREIPDLSHKDQHNTPDTVEIPCDTKVIAVHGRNQGFLRAGILASSDGDYILTDSSWKCSNVSYSGWQNVGYNDSFWQPAIDCGPNRGCSRPVKEIYYGSVPSISPYARWIWLRQWSGRLNSNHEEMDMEVFCRKTLYSEEIEVNDSPVLSLCQPRQSFKLSITADDSVHLYIDGIKVAHLPNGHCFDTPDAVDVPWDTKVVAVHAKRFRGSEGGILASADGNYVLTNSSWKCSDLLYPGWQAVGYNDSFWSSAYDFGSNGRNEMWHNGIRYPRIQNVNSEARWIWLKHSNSTDEEMADEVFCRKTLSTDLRNCNCESREEMSKKFKTSSDTNVENNSATFITCLATLLGFSLVGNLVLIPALCILYRKHKPAAAARRHRSRGESFHDRSTARRNSQADENAMYESIIQFDNRQGKENKGNSTSNVY